MIQKIFSGFASAVAPLCVLLAAAVSRADEEIVSQEKKPRSLRVAAASVVQIPRDIEGNLRRIEAWARRAAQAGAELVLFPEAAISGWWQSREIRRYGEPAKGPSIQRLIKLANELDIAMAVGMTEIDGENAYITHVLLDGRGVIGKHRKSSLAGGKNGEGRVWDEGDDFSVFTYKHIQLGIAICFESVHPETCRRLKAKGAEIILAPYANGTRPSELLHIEEGRKSGKRTYAYARAVENRVWYVACDSAPRNSKDSRQAGAAYIIDPRGRLVKLSDPNQPGENMVVHTIGLPSKPPRRLRL